MSSPSDAIAVGSPRIFWERDGSSHVENVVFIHALGCNLDLWDAIVPLIRAGVQNIRDDLSSHGRSAARPDEFSIEDHARDLIQVLDECGAGNLAAQRVRPLCSQEGSAWNSTKEDETR